MNFSWPIDGTIVGVYLLVTMIAGLLVRKYVSRVEDFLVAGRELNIYLGIASLAATEFGIITCMYTAQAGFTNGFAGALPGLCQAGAMFVIGITGFCVKPLRDSGAMTLPELFEKRFGKFVRWLAGVVIVFGGLLNMGVFLKIGGDFLCLVCGFDIRYLATIMTALLVLVAVYTILGGMLSVLVTDFLQFIVMSIGLLVVTVMILQQIGWERLVSTVEGRWTDQRAILWNRCIVALIGVYLLVFGLLYTIEGNVWSYLLLTGSIYLSSMSVLLIACCYWPRANDWGALGAIFLGAAVPIAQLSMEKLPATAAFAASFGKDAAGIAAFVAAAFGMIAGSLLKPRAASVK